ncbi:MAG TPA: DUF4430 domain-containing protein [Solirubrobacterales bacterium]|nr:DUF4430 domain-containing protein [Solirubrobacterales bacterium]
MRRAAPAVAGALCAALAAAGCGVGPGKDVGQVRLLVTRDYGATILVPTTTEDVKETDDVLRVLDRHADVGTRYSGRFVQSVNGIEGGRSDGRLVDWFYSVNGIEPAIGSTDYELGDGDRVWWDHRDWTAAMRMPANVGAFPEPFLHGYEGERHAVVLDCHAPPGCVGARSRLEEAGVPLAGAAEPDAIRILLGPWPLVRRDPTAKLVEAGPSISGVFARFVRGPDDWRLELLDERGEVDSVRHSGAALVAAIRDGDGPPVWLVTGLGPEGVRDAAGLLDEETLAGKYAAGPGGEALPAR